MIVKFLSLYRFIKELNAALDRLITATNSLKQTKRPTLRALLNITAWAIELKGLNNSKANRKLFFDGRILDATDQVKDLLKQSFFSQ